LLSSVRGLCSYRRPSTMSCASPSPSCTPLSCTPPSCTPPSCTPPSCTPPSCTPPLCTPPLAPSSTMTTRLGSCLSLHLLLILSIMFHPHIIQDVDVKEAGVTHGPA